MPGRCLNLLTWSSSPSKMDDGHRRGFHAMSSFRKAGLGSLAAILLLLSPRTTRAASDKPGTGSPLSAAICPIVYPVDQSPSERGYHYIFYGNAFFINKEGYLLTAAHVLNQLHDAQPYILLQSPMAPPRLVKVAVVIADQDHDVAVLRATPNPFEGKYAVNFLRLSTRRPEQAHEVLADALRPSRLKNPYTFDALLEDRPAGEVIEYRFTQLDKGRPDTEIFLFNHDVLLGDSGAPVISSESHEVVGLVEGRWLHGGTMAMVNAVQKQSTGLGAVVPMHYAIALLQQKGIAWQGVPETPARVEPDAPPSNQFAAPVPLSLVAAPYPAEVFAGCACREQRETGRHTNTGRGKPISGKSSGRGADLDFSASPLWQRSGRDEDWNHVSISRFVDVCPRAAGTPLRRTVGSCAGAGSAAHCCPGAGILADEIG